jgi:RNA polymerase sigma factor (sigma-70 family)
VNAQVLRRKVSPGDAAFPAETDPDLLISALDAQHRPALVAYVTRLVSDPYQAEDVVQETMVRAWRNADRLTPERGSISGWLKRVAHNVAVDKIRARRARPAEILVAEAPPQVLPDHSPNVVETIFVKHALERLSPAQRAVLREVYFADRTAAQAAEELGIPVGTVKSRVHHALRNLRVHLEEQMAGALTPVEETTGGQPAETAGDAWSGRMQRLMNGTQGDSRRQREDLRGSVIERFGDTAGVLVVDESEFLKLGTHSTGSRRYHSGTAGKGVFLTYATARGGALIDAELYLPKSLTANRTWCEQAGVPANVGFATKPALARAMISRALQGRIPIQWVTADEAYGQGQKFRHYLEQRHLGYVVAVPRNLSLSTDDDGTGLRADQITADAPEHAWKRLSAGAQAYDWAVATLPPRPDDDVGAGEPFARWLLVRRSIPASGKAPELAYYMCYGPAGTPLTELVRIAGMRSAVEECFAVAKSEGGLNQYQVLRYDAWHRHVTVAMLAHAQLAATAPAPKAQDSSPPSAAAVSWQV